MARALGLPLMPWQQLVADVGGEIDSDTGLPAYREVIVTVPRQSGKTTLVLSWEIQRALGWESPQRILYSAQTGNDARKKLIEDQVPILEPRKAKLGIRRILKGMGNEAIEFRNGSRIVLMASGDDSGHGKTLDLGVKDELFADADHRRDQAMVPAMATRASAQMLTPSTMGTDLSIALNQAVERGRAAADAGVRSGVAYFEWSAPDDSDPEDPAIWWSCMPALGETITQEVVEHARMTLSLPEFRRAFLNIRDGNRGDPVIAAADWAACLADMPKGRIPVMADPACLAFDISPDRSSAAIGAAGECGERTMVEIVRHDQGTGWIADYLADVVQSQKPAVVICDAAGPAGGIIPDLSARGVIVQVVTAREHSQGCGGLFDDVKNRKLLHIGQSELDAAVAGADRRLVGDSWLWSRKSSSVDISPLVAVTLARWAHLNRPRPAKPRAAWV